MSDEPLNVLFLCTGNSARSILAEALVNHWGRGKFVGYSAGSAPKGKVHPIALELLKHMKMPTEGMRSKSWDEFEKPGAPRLDFVFTVCDNAAAESCPVWPGQPMTAHWGVEDPAAVEGSDTEKWLAFRQAFRELESRIKIFTSLPLRSLDRVKLQERLHAIGSPLHRRSCVMFRRTLAEALGALLLTACVVGSGIMAERLAGGNSAIALLANTLATVAVLATLIAHFGPISGGHFNPVVSAVAAYRRQIDARTAASYAVAQIAGCCAGAMLANAMFELPLVQASTHIRSGFAQWLSEIVATGGLIFIAFSSPSLKEAAWRVPLWIGAAYWFTASTSFANPAITLGRALSDTFAGIRPIDAPGFIGAQIAGALVGAVLLRMFHEKESVA